jgi:S-adenosylmethionine/arginine decarboxylase-like enzyme
MKAYGKELILDLHECNVDRFNRRDIDKYFVRVCRLTNMVRCERFWWDDVGVPEEERQTALHTKGTTAVDHSAARPLVGTQFILTSNITVHSLELLRAIHVNVFTCKNFDPQAVEKFTAKWFGGDVVQSLYINRL